MPALGMNEQELRRLLEASFEPHGDGFAYFKNRWAPGIPVTAAEREEYLANWTFASGRAFRDKIKGRAPVLPPRGGEAAWRVLDAMPLWTAAGFVGVGVICLRQGLGLGIPWLRYPSFLAAAVFGLMALLMVIRRISHR